MEVILADKAGTCFGVQRALDLANEVVAEGKEAMTLGSLIHNPRVVEGFASKGVIVADTPEDVVTPCVVIRSHGVLPEVRRALESRDLEIVDATCPFVLRAQKCAQKLAQDGCAVVVVGEANHPEVEAIVAVAKEAGGRVVVVTSGDELPCDLVEPVGVVVQTTQRAEALDDVVASLRGRGIEPRVDNTICSATAERQDAAMRLAQEVDAMVVLGGKSSSNTTRLAEICRESCARTFHIEGPDELDASQFEGCKRIGVTAGASTPQDQIAEIICTLKAL